MAKANDQDNLLSYFNFKEKLSKKIKEKEVENEAYSYDFDEEKEQEYIPEWAKDDDYDVVEKPTKKDVDVDPELAKMIAGKEDENKELQDKHKKEIEKELKDGDE